MKKITEAELKRLIKIQRDVGMPWHTPGSVKRDLGFTLKLIKRYLNGQEVA